VKVKVSVIWWDSPYLPPAFVLWCPVCDRSLGTFSKHESAMNWAQAHAGGSKHIRRKEET